MRLVHYTYPSFRTATPAFRGFQRSPWSGFESEIDRLFETALADLGDTASPSRFPVDLYEDKANTYVRAELPGVSRDDIKVELSDGTLTIAASRQTPAHSTGSAGSPPAGSGQAVGGKPADALSFSRSLCIADEVQADKITASYENGVLTVTLPKREVAAPKKITVAVQ